MSETKIKTKKKTNKMAIAVVTLSLALIAAIGGIFGVYAALQQNVSTTFSVQYSIGKNVAVAIGAQARNTITGDAVAFEADPSLSKNESNLYTIGVNDSNKNVNLHLPASSNGILSITGAAVGIEIQFLFENISSNTLKLTVTDNCTRVGGIAAYYSYHYGNLNNKVFLDDLSESIEIPAGQMCAFIVSVYLANLEDEGARPDINKSASYTSDENGGLSFKIEQA